MKLNMMNKYEKIPSRKEIEKIHAETAKKNEIDELENIKQEIISSIYDAVKVLNSNHCTVNIRHMHTKNVKLLLKELRDLGYDCDICNNWLEIRWSPIKSIYGQNNETPRVGRSFFSFRKSG